MTRTSPTPESHRHTGAETECKACAEARERMRSIGFARRDLHKYGCYDCAAVDWDEFCAARGLTFDGPQVPDQPDLFSHPLRSAA